MFGFRNRRRARLRAKPLSTEWWRVIDQRVPYARQLSEADRHELGGIIQILLHEKNFEGCGGLEMTDEIRLTIAAQAAVLLLHRESDYYPTLKSILVYPSAYFAPAKQRQPDGTIIEGPQARLGESWFRGSLVLSWSDVRRSAAEHDDGRNIVFHEFAHQLDGEDGSMNGAPRLDRTGCYQDWARVLGEEFKQLTQDVHRGYRSLLDPYGSTSPPEFFAVATEVFFERPAAMKQEHPELYEQLACFYAQDPAAQQMVSGQPV
jgi:Mlc titration factor MtfA (ptsG expression regulator)